MTTISSRDDETYDNASETRSPDPELSVTRQTVKRLENINDFRPTTRASARQENGDRQIRILKSRSRSPPRWTRQNPRWQEEKRWKTSLVYPTEGKQRTTVDARDIERLDEGEFLNDNLIAFFLRFLEVQLEKSRPELSKRIYFKNTFFYETLTKGKVRSNNINYDAVKRWTNKVDIFSYDYIIVPVCEKFHWYVAIICNAPKLLPQSDGVDQGQHEEDEIAIVDSVHKPTVYLEDHEDDSLLNIRTPEIRHETSAVEQPENFLRTDSASPSVTTQVEHMSLEDGKDEWPEPDAPPQQWKSNSALVQNSGSAEQLSEDVRGKDSIERNVESVDIPRKSKKLKRKSLPPPRRYDPREPRIITLDSLGGTHSPTCSNLRAYLVCEAKERKHADITPGSLGMTATGLPQQSNYCDCGVFILGYVKKFLEDPDTFVRGILQKDVDQIGRWPEMDAAKMRGTIRQLIFRLHDEQTEKANEQRELKYRANKVLKNETKHATSTPPDTGSHPLSITTKAVSRAEHSEPNSRRPNQPSSLPVDSGRRKSTKHRILEDETSMSAPVDAQRSSVSPIEKPVLRNRMDEKHVNQVADTATTNFNSSQDVEIIETPAPSFGRHTEPSKRRLDSTDTSPLRSPLRRRVSTFALESPFKPARYTDDVVEESTRRAEEKATKSNIFKQFAKYPTSPYQNTRQRTRVNVLDEHSPVEIDDSRDTYELEVRETPPRALEREESFEDILEIQDSNPPSTPRRRETEGSVSLTNSHPITRSKSSPRTLRSSPRDSERYVTLSESPKHKREIRRMAKN